MARRREGDILYNINYNMESVDVEDRGGAVEVMYYFSYVNVI